MRTAALSAACRGKQVSHGLRVLDCDYGRGDEAVLASGSCGIPKTARKRHCASSSGRKSKCNRSPCLSTKWTRRSKHFPILDRVSHFPWLPSNSLVNFVFAQELGSRFLGSDGLSVPRSGESISDAI
jgi:hypothetical protein